MSVKILKSGKEKKNNNNTYLVPWGGKVCWIISQILIFSVTSTLLFKTPYYPIGQYADISKFKKYNF